MASNRILLWHSISRPEFVHSFGAEAQCSGAVKAGALARKVYASL